MPESRQSRSACQDCQEAQLQRAGVERSRTRFTPPEWSSRSSEPAAWRAKSKHNGEEVVHRAHVLRAKEAKRVHAGAPRAQPRSRGSDWRTSFDDDRADHPEEISSSEMVKGTSWRTSKRKFFPGYIIVRDGAERRDVARRRRARPR